MDYNKIIEEMPKDLTKIEQARYLYIQIGRYFSYDERYITAQSIRQRSEIFNKKPEEMQDDKGVCSSLAKVYTKLLKDIGIDAKTTLFITEEDRKKGLLGHGFTEFKIDGKKYFAGISGDLMNIKTGFRTKEFMNDCFDRDYIKYDTISEEELKIIDDKLGYTYNGLYMEDFTEQLHKEMKLLNYNVDEETIKDLGIEDLEGKELTKFKIDFITKHMGHEDLNCLEKNNYFKQLVEECIGYKEIEQYFELSSVTCINSDSSIRFFKVLKDKEEGKKIIYTTSGKDQITQITQAEIKRLFNSGMKTLSKSREKENIKTLLDEPKEKSRSALHTKKEKNDNSLAEYKPNIWTRMINSAKNKLKQIKERLTNKQDNADVNETLTNKPFAQEGLPSWNLKNWTSKQLKESTVQGETRPKEESKSKQEPEELE